MGPIEGEATWAWWWVIGALAPLIALVWFWRGPRLALVMATGAAAVIPTWVAEYFWGARVDVRVAAAICSLGLYVFHPRSTFPWRLVVLDVLMLAMVGVHIISDSLAQGFQLSIVLRAYGEWVLPYLCGRLMVQCWDDIRQATPWLAGVVFVLGAMAIAEALTKQNPWELVFGPRPIDSAIRDLQRWGFKRAYGPTRHANFLGLLLVTLSPWAWQQLLTITRREFAPLRVGLGMGIHILGLISSGSRAIVLGLPLLVTGAVFCAWKPSRWPIFGLLVTMSVLMVAQYQPIMKTLEEWSGERQTWKGRRLASTSTEARLKYMEVYGDAMQQAGVFGYGTDRTTGFPVRVPMRAEYIQLLETSVLRFLDNAYILFDLRFGHAGVTLFALLLVVGFVTAMQLRNVAPADVQPWVAVNAGMLVMMSLSLATIWLAHDFGFYLIMSLGSLAGLQTARRHYGMVEEQAAPAPRPRIRRPVRDRSVQPSSLYERSELVSPESRPRPDDRPNI